MKLAIFGSSQIIYHHIKAAKNNSFNIFAIYSSNKKSKNVKNIAKKFKIQKIYYNWKSLAKDSFKNNCSVLIAGRIKDNKKILEYCLKYNLKILVEKPLFTRASRFGKLLKFKNNIFLGYNRIYYKNIIELKKIIKKKKPYNINVKCPEINKKNIIQNSCHIISILFYLFGKIFLLKKIKNKKSIFCIFKTKKNIMIFISINFNSPDNFLIEFNFIKERATLCPIEKLNIYNKLKKNKIKNTNIYTPSIKKSVDEYKYTNLKPGFDKQYANFKNFILNKRCQFINIYQAKQIISICEKIAK